MIDTRLQSARDLHRAGKLAEAIGAYGEILAADAARFDVWHLKAIAEHQKGDLEASEASIARALERGGGQAPIWLLAGRIRADRGDLAGAEAAFARATAIKPDWGPPWASLGEARMDLGRFAGAMEAFQEATRLGGDNPALWNNLGLALLALERPADAERAFNHALTMNPAHANANFNLARVLLMRSDMALALTHAQHAVRSDPAHVDAHLLVADLHRKRRDPAATQRALEAAIEAVPGSAKAWTSYCEFMWETGHPDEAKAEYAKTAQRFPGNLKAAFGANLLLAPVYRDLEHLEAMRAGYAEGLERLHEQAGRFRYRNAAEALAEARWTNFYLAYQGGEDRELQVRFGQFVRKVLEPAAPELLAPRRRRDRGARIRVGFLSHHFYNCTAGRYFSSWVTRLDRRRFETIAYYTNEWVADDTRALAAACDRFRHLPGRPLEAIARHVIADDLDVLVYPELGMHPDTFTLASLRLAPVQCAGWGHPNTTGLPEIDWYLSPAAMEPEDAGRLYSEKLALLPGLGTRYATPSGVAQGSRADFGLPEDRNLYLVPQSLFKIHPDNDALLADVLARDPKGLLVLYAAPHEPVTMALGARLALALGVRGMLLEDRAIFLRYMTHGEYLRVNRLCDVMLDTRHWSGGNTSLDALAMGLPVVTLPGTLMRGRQSLAMLGIVGAPDLVASDAGDYAEKAVRLATDRDAREDASRRILAGLPALFERDEPIRALEAFLEKAAIP